MAGAATTELPAANDQRTSPLRASSANIVLLAGLGSIEAANTTPLATLAGPNPMQPCWHCATGLAVCQRILPSFGSSAAHDPVVAGLPEGCSVYCALRQLAIGT